MRSWLKFKICAIRFEVGNKSARGTFYTAQHSTSVGGCAFEATPERSSWQGRRRAYRTPRHRVPTNLNKQKIFLFQPPNSIQKEAWFKLWQDLPELQM
jgi:hypothetical protein